MRFRRVACILGFVLALRLGVTTALRLAYASPIVRGFYRDARSKGPLPVLRRGLWGYVDHACNIVIPPQFDGADFFYEGLAAVLLGGKWGFIDTTGTPVIPPQFTSVGTFSDGLANVFIDAAPPIYGYVDKAGSLIRCTTPCLRPYSEGLMANAVRDFRCPDQGSREVPKVNPCAADAASGPHAPLVAPWGYYDKRGRLSIPGPFSGTGRFSEGLAPAQPYRAHKFGYIDARGAFAIGPQFDSAEPFSEGLAAVQTEGRWGFVDHQGHLAIPAQFEGASPFSDGYAAVTVSGKKGYIDKTGQISIVPRFSAAEPFSEGLAAACCENGKTGYIDETGSFVIPAAYPPGSRVAGPFSEGVALVATSRGPIYIDRSGRTVALVIQDSPGKKGKSVFLTVDGTLP